MMTMHLISASAAFWSPTQATPSATAIGPRRLMNLTSSRSVSPGFAIARNLALSMPVYTAVLPRNSADLCQRLQTEHCRHDRVAREVSLEEKLVSRQVQRTNRVLLIHFKDFVHQQHRRTMRQDLHDLFFIQHISYTSFSSSASGFYQSNAFLFKTGGFEKPP